MVGVTSIDTRVAEVTVSIVDADTAPRLAEIIVEPGPVVVVIPFEPGALLIEATRLADLRAVRDDAISAAALGQLGFAEQGFAIYSLLYEVAALGGETALEDRR